MQHIERLAFLLGTRRKANVFCGHISTAEGIKRTWQAANRYKGATDFELRLDFAD